MNAFHQPVSPYVHIFLICARKRLCDNVSAGKKHLNGSRNIVERVAFYEVCVLFQGNRQLLLNTTYCLYNYYAGDSISNNTITNVLQVEHCKELYPYPQNASISLYSLLLQEIRSRQLNKTSGCQGN
jgi:hypothetical protein